MAFPLLTAALFAAQHLPLFRHETPWAEEGQPAPDPAPSPYIVDLREAEAEP